MVLRTILTTALLLTATACATHEGALYSRILRALPDGPGESVDDPRREVRPGLFAHSPPVLEAMDAGERSFASTNARGALCVRTGEGDPEVIAAPEGDWRWDIEGARWSGDGAWIAAKMVDDTSVARFTIDDGGGGTREVAYSYAGTEIPKKRLYLMQRDGGAKVEVPLSLDYVHLLGWTSDAGAFRFVEADRTNRHVVLRSYAREGGQVTTLMEEKGSSWSLTGLALGDGYSGRFDSANLLTFLDDERFVWLSERSGDKHLYLYAPDCAERVLTAELDGLLLDVVGIDPVRQLAVLLTVASDEPWAPRRLVRLDLEEASLRPIFEAETIEFAEYADGKVQVAVAAFPDVMEFHHLALDGSRIAPPDRADLAFLRDEPVRVEPLTLPAADGATLLQALLVTPAKTPAEPMPLIEMIYGGPHFQMVPMGPVDHNLCDAHVLAEAGFAVLFIDARGTPGRSSPFAHAQDGRFGATVIPDHAAAVRHLLATRSELDPERVGIVGHSWGGYFSLRAMIEAPDFYRAAILLSPNTNVSEMRVPVEAYQGCLPVDCPEAYAQGDLVPKLDLVEGPILIVQGSADDDVLPEVAEKLAVAMRKAGVDHELVRLKDVNHIVQRDPDHLNRVIAFFRRALAR